MRRAAVVVALVMTAAACGGGSGGREGGASFSGTFDVEPGVGPGEVSFVLDETGDRIVSAVIDPGLDGFACPTGVRISGGGVTSTYTPGVEIEGDSFETFGWSGTFDSATEVHGEYDLQPAYDCPYTLTWSASTG